MCAGTYQYSERDGAIALASDVNGAAAAYDDPSVNTVLLYYPLSEKFRAVAAPLSATEIDQCCAFLDRIYPDMRAGYDQLSPEQCRYIDGAKDVQHTLEAVFYDVVGAGSMIDKYRYVKTRRGVERTAIPHIDQCDSHMAATLSGPAGTLLYLEDFSHIAEQNFKDGAVQPDPCKTLDFGADYLCFIKGTDHPHIMNNPHLISRWHGSPIIEQDNEARIGLFFAMRNGLGMS